MEVASASADHGGDFFEQLEAAAAAEPMDPEDDLILRMEQSAKVHGGGGGGSRASRSFAKEKRAFKGLTGGAGSRGIVKQRRQPQRAWPEGMKVDSTSRPSTMAAVAAAVVAHGADLPIPPPLKLKRSHSI